MSHMRIPYSFYEAIVIVLLLYDCTNFVWKAVCANSQALSTESDLPFFVIVAHNRSQMAYRFSIIDCTLSKSISIIPISIIECTNFISNNRFSIMRMDLTILALNEGRFCIRGRLVYVCNVPCMHVGGYLSLYSLHCLHVRIVAAGQVSLSIYCLHEYSILPQLDMDLSPDDSVRAKEATTNS